MLQGRTPAGGVHAHATHGVDHVFLRLDAVLMTAVLVVAVLNVVVVLRLLLTHVSKIPPRGM